MKTHIMQYTVFTNSITYFNNYSVSKISMKEDWQHNSSEQLVGEGWSDNSLRNGLPFRSKHDGHYRFSSITAHLMAWLTYRHTKAGLLWKDAALKNGLGVLLNIIISHLKAAAILPPETLQHSNRELKSVLLTDRKRIFNLVCQLQNNYKLRKRILDQSKINGNIK